VDPPYEEDSLKEAESLVEPPYEEDSLEEAESLVEPPYQEGSDEVAGDLVEEILSDTLFTTSAVTNASSTYPGCNHVDFIVDSYTIAACNVGATLAGTSETSYGSLFQRGNNFGFSNDATNTAPTPNSTTRPDVSAY
jgi:hypothetical protein